MPLSLTSITEANRKWKNSINNTHIGGSSGHKIGNDLNNDNNNSNKLITRMTRNNIVTKETRRTKIENKKY